MSASSRPLTLSLLSLSLFSLSLLACGAHGKTGIPEGSDKPWADMDHDERMAHMGAVVMPRAQAVFEGHDPERFSTFGCATCHGGGASDGSFAMPNPGLPQLDAANLYKKHRKETPDMVKLMWKHVEPTMGEALAVTYGFDGAISCGSCHIVINEKE
jgi:hypothetical protein